MAQNSDALQEPSMDELLASIREIIEENTGAPPQDGRSRAGFQNQSRDGRAQPAENSGSAQHRGGYDVVLPHLRQDIRLRSDKNAAAARPQADMPPQNNAPARNNGAQNGGAYQNAAPQQGRGGAANNNGRPNREAYSALPPRQAFQREPYNPNPAGQSAPAAAEPRPVQESMNALAERIGLRRAASFASPPEGQGKPVQQGQNFARAAAAPQPSQPFAAPLPAADPAQENFAQNGRAALPRQEQAYAGEGGRRQNGGEELRPRFNPAAAAAHYQHEAAALSDKIRASEARENNRQAQAAAPQSAKLRAEYGEGDSRNGESFSLRSDLPREEREKSAEFDKNFPADVEHSTENLLRPFITEWLDGHFRDLFEKILREEVQRFICSMRRGS